MKYKVGDRVKYDSEICTVTKVLESQGKFKYRVQSDTWFDVVEDEMIEGLVEEETKPLTYEETVEIIETMQGIGDSWECPQGYQFVDENGNVINATKIVLEKKIDKDMTENNTKVDMGEMSDGYHTFNELYEYRMLYNAALFNEFAKQGLYDVHKSRKHSDGEYPFGDSNWFIVMAELPTGQISNHYEMKDWDKFQIPEKPLANKWDEHSPRDVANRLASFTTPKKEYPKTYEECAKVLLDRASVRNDLGYKGDLLVALQKLLVCRDAYWKIAGKEMGLGKPWEPSDSDYITGRYCIFVHRGNIICDTPAQDCVLTFPTPEMRDAFYENFKSEIESCKELL